MTKILIFVGLIEDDYDDDSDPTYVESVSVDLEKATDSLPEIKQWVCEQVSRVKVESLMNDEPAITNEPITNDDTLH